MIRVKMHLSDNKPMLPPAFQHKVQAGRVAVARRLLRHRDDFFQVAVDWTPVIQATAESGAQFLVSTRDMEIGRLLYAGGHWDLNVMRQLIRYTADLTGRDLRDRTLLDVGANIGTTSVYAVKSFAANHVHAFEPAPGNVKLLRQNVELNDIAGRVTVHEMAISNMSGRAALSLSADNPGDHRIVINGPEIGNADARAGQLIVSVDTLDHLADSGTINAAEIGLLWVDTQGHEGHVIAGAARILAAGIPVVMEYWPAGLQRANGLQLLEDNAREHFTHFADHQPANGLAPYAARSITELPKLREAYGDERHTDIILWRQSA